MDQTATIDAEIRQILDDRIAAITDKDLDRLMSPVASDILSFDLLDPLRNTGSAAVRQRATNWFTGYQSTIGYEIRDLAIKGSNSLAIATYLYHVSGTLKTGDQVSMWVRATTGFERRGDTWVIVHEHQSVPFNVDTGMASLDLEP